MKTYQSDIHAFAPQICRTEDGRKCHQHDKSLLKL